MDWSKGNSFFSIDGETNEINVAGFSEYLFGSDDDSESVSTDSENVIIDMINKPSTFKKAGLVAQVNSLEPKLDDNDSPQEAAKKTNDFDIMMDKRTAHRIAWRNKLKRFELNNEQCADLVHRMFDAAQEDMDLYANREPATKKVAMLKEINAIFSRPFQIILLDHNILGAFAAWITPLSEKWLPYYPIREAVLTALLKLPSVDKDDLRHSCIAKAVTFLSKHPAETLENKKICKRLLDSWARQLYNIEIDYRALTTEERMERDLSYGEVNPRNKDTASVNKPGGEVGNTGLFAIKDNKEKAANKLVTPKQFTEIPKPCDKLFVNRPKSKVDYIPSPKKCRNEVAYNQVIKNCMKLRKAINMSSKRKSNFFDKI